MRTRIIHWLGGNTDKDMELAVAAATDATFHAVVDHLIEYAQEMDGKSGDEWADKMYKHLERMQNIETTSECDENGNISVTTKTVDKDDQD